MRAITQNTFGGPEVLTVTDRPRPVLRPTEVLVRVCAAGVNPVDAAVRSGAYPLLGEPPFGLGWEISGVVEEVSAGTARFHRGDEVFGLVRFPLEAGGYAEFVSAPSRMLAAKPAALDHVHAAGLPLAGLTAWQGLVEFGGLKTGHRVLVHGAAGGVGHLAVQIATALGARVVATAWADKHAFVRSLGADEVIDYRATDFTEVARDVDVAFDVIGGDYGPRSLRTLRPGGTLVTVVDDEMDPGPDALGRRVVCVGVEPDHVGLSHLSRLADAGRLGPHIGHVLPLTEAAAAHRLIEAGHGTGKIVLVP